jgi:hypothetical protein
MEKYVGESVYLLQSFASALILFTTPKPLKAKLAAVFQRLTGAGDVPAAG